MEVGDQETDIVTLETQHSAVVYGCGDYECERAAEVQHGFFHNMYNKSAVLINLFIR